MAIENIGFEVIAELIGGNGTDLVEGDAIANDLDHARAIGVENGNFGDVTEGFNVKLGRGIDEVNGTATATSDRGQAFADGILNTGNIELQGGFDRVEGSANATTTANGVITMATGINSTDGGRIRGNGGADLFQGEATAEGQNNVNAFATLVTDLRGGNGNDRITGTAVADGITTTDARGISVGFSDIDDDTIASPENVGLAPTADGEAEVGELFGSQGNDVLEGTADVTIEAQNGDEIFFAGANGIVNDGGTLDQLENLLNTIGKDLTNFNSNDIEQIIARLNTSTLDTGIGDDRLIADVTLNVAQNGNGADADLEVIGDGIENAGDVLLGDGNDSVNSTVSLTTTISGAKGLADALDNSSVGIITGLNLEVNNETLFDLGAGNDTFTSNIFATAVDDLSAADGLGNRAIFVAGAGDDTFDLTSLSRFVLQNENDGEQQEGIADGWENRSRVFLDDRAGNFAGNDSVTTSATAFGEGVLTIAEGLETREFFDAGGGNDSFNLSGSANTGVGALADNLTQAAGLQTEQVTSGEFILGEGDNSVNGNAVAISEAVAGTDDDGGEFTPTTFAFGITQMTADANNAEDAGDFSAEGGDDTLNGTSNATGERDVAAFGLLFSNADLGNGLNTLRGNATATSKVSALANGISVGTDDVFVKRNSVVNNAGIGQTTGLIKEAGELDTGADDDFIEGIATATANGNALIDSDANGILIDLDSIFNTGGGADTVNGRATANSNGASNDPEFGILVDGIENKGRFATGAGDDNILGEGFAFGDGVEAISGGIDNGRALVEQDSFVPPVFTTGNGSDEIVAIAEAEAVNNAAITDALSNVGDFLTEDGVDLITATAVSKAFGTANDRAVADAIDNRGFFSTGGDNDKIVATATAEAVNGSATVNAIDQNEVAGSEIDLGSGNDMIVAEAAALSGSDLNAIALLGGTINAGDGADNIRGRSNSNLVGNNLFGGSSELSGGQAFGGDVEINMGAGNDTLFGFGEAIVDGGSGIDTLEFEFSVIEFLSGGGTFQLSGDLTFGGITYQTRNFELFKFDSNFETNSVVTSRQLAAAAGDPLVLGVSEEVDQNVATAPLALDNAPEVPNDFNSVEDLVSTAEAIEVSDATIV